ncbi:hypothetical protein [Aliivibrio finisterrensis]|uniref:Uncharacterized protein n=1 Tax=Aliivibrio finisterrensis TaxID=511998 RepID=A0A6N6RWW7_9GAMM|nr:hypothetical protein [Aliivibrio finisterrensis]KAB2826216.1 hypothetical protein F8B77_03130 [Aliivibrio finisterrensis]
MSKSNPLSVLLKINAQLEAPIDSRLIEQCYAIQQKHQFDKERNSVNEIKKVVEASISIPQGDLSI